MAKSFGTMSVTGHVGRSYYKEGVGGKKSFAKLSLGIFNSSFRDGMDEEIKTIWTNVLVFGKDADSLRGACVDKGDFVSASGFLGMEHWENKEGETVKNLTVIAQNVSYMKKEGGQTYTSEASAGANTARTNARTEIEDDEIPF